jgi:hypothetical protein
VSNLLIPKPAMVLNSEALPLLTITFCFPEIHLNVILISSIRATGSAHYSLLCRIWDSHRGAYEDFCHLGHNTVQSIESQQNMSPTSSGSKNSFKQAASRTLRGLFFNAEDGGDVFLRNIGWLSTDYIAFYPRIKTCSLSHRFHYPKTTRWPV